MADTNRADRGARFLLIAASLVLVVAGLRALRPIAVPLLLAIFLSILSAPLLGWLTRHRWPKAIAVPATVLATVLAMSALLLLVGGSVNAFLQSLPKYQVQVESKLASGLEWLEEQGVDTSELSWLRNRRIESREADDELTGAPVEPPSPRDAGPANLIDVSALFDLLTSTLAGVASIVSMGLIVFLMMVFILFEASGLPERFRVAFGWRRAELRRLTAEIQLYLGIKTLISLATGILIGTWTWVLGCDYPLLWALIAFVFNYVPSIGSILAAIPAVILTLIDLGLFHATLVAIGYLVVNIVLGNFVEPHLMGRRFGMSTLAVLLSLVFWGWLWGPLGMLLAVPLTMILKILMQTTEDFRWVAQLISPPPRPAVNSD